MQRRQAQRDGYVHTLEAEVSRLRAAGEAEAEAAAASLQRTHALEAELVPRRRGTRDGLCTPMESLRKTASPSRTQRRRSCSTQWMRTGHPWQS